MLSDYVLFIDAEAIVIDKPAGQPVDAPRRGGESIASRVDELRCGFRRSPTPMHRLDTDTSGCLLFARSPKARSAFQQAFEGRAVEKYYLAVIGSEIAEESGVIDTPLAKQSSAEAGWKMVPDTHGLEAITHWRRIAVRDGSTLVEFRPRTGRTHQIRAHARAAFGSGIVGDRLKPHLSSSRRDATDSPPRLGVSTGSPAGLSSTIASPSMKRIRSESMAPL